MLRLSIVILCCFFVTSCGEYEQLERKKVLERRADSLYSRKRDSIRRLTDTLCDKDFDQYYQEALDSIKLKQIKEIRDLIEK